MENNPEENRGWKERHFFSLNLNPKVMPEDNPSTLPDLKTNPAAYPEPAPGEAPTTPGDKVKPEGAAKEPFRDPVPNPTDEANAPKPPNPADPTAPPAAAPPEPHPGEPTNPVPEAALKESKE